MEPVFDSTDLDEVREFLSTAYSAMRISGRATSARTRISRHPLGPINLDRLSFGCDLTYAVEPLGRLGLASVHGGGIDGHRSDGLRGACGPGEVLLIAQPDLPFAGRMHRLRCDFAQLDPALLARVADGGRSAPRLTGLRPVSAAAGRHLRATLTFLHAQVLAEPTPLTASTAPQLLAATVLNTFPHNAVLDPTGADRRDAHPAALRRAIAFIDAHAGQDIGAAEIAEAAHVTIRAVQCAFRRHRGTTPMEYLREVRLGQAHQELLAADPEVVTVTQVAARWGFFHPGRFAARYRASYGCSPSTTLLRQH